jgi:hypothetical protein
MATGTHTARHVRNASQGRAIVTLLVLFAFLLQSFVVQTHVHFSSAASATERVFFSTASHPHGFAGGNDANQCPWCQAALSSGTYVMPAALPIRLPVVLGFADPILLDAVITTFSTSHAWRSRAPPV